MMITFFVVLEFQDSHESDCMLDRLVAVLNIVDENILRGFLRAEGLSFEMTCRLLQSSPLPLSQTLNNILGKKRGNKDHRNIYRVRVITLARERVDANPFNAMTDTR
jgi:hypothetical protein